MFRDAHAEDFERKRKPELGMDPRDTKVEDEDSDSESEAEREDAGDESGADGGEEGEEGRDSDEEVEDDEEESALARIREDLEVGMSGVRGKGAG